VSKERCLKIAARTGIQESFADLLISKRDETALKDLKAYASVSKFYYPLIWYFIELV